jgi:hypothetical protein
MAHLQSLMVARPKLAQAKLKAFRLDHGHSIVIELEAHDVSRFEWCVAVPLPAHEPLKYTVQAEFDLPSISISSRSPWDQLQGFTRLEEPEMVRPLCEA